MLPSGIRKRTWVHAEETIEYKKWKWVNEERIQVTWKINWWDDNLVQRIDPDNNSTSKDRRILIDVRRMDQVCNIWDRCK